MKFSGAVFQALRAGHIDPHTFFCGPRCPERTSPLACYYFASPPLDWKVFRDGDVGHLVNLVYMVTQ